MGVSKSIEDSVKNRASRVHPQSRTPFAILSPSSKDERHRLQHVTHYNQLREMSVRLKTCKAALISTHAETVTDAMSEPGKDKIARLIQYVVKHATTKAVLQGIMVERLKKHVSEENLTEEEVEMTNEQLLLQADSLVNISVGQLEAEVLRFRGKGKQVQHCPETLMMSQLIINRSSKLFEELKELGLNLPSIRTMQRHKAAQTIDKGTDSIVYVAARGALGHNNTVDGTLKCDEMKLQQGFYWNTKTLEIIGFADDQGNSLEDAVERWLNVDAARTPKQLAVYVNQFMFVSICGRVSFLASFFFNAGKLNGSEIADQFRYVTRCCGAVGFRVLGYNMDAGGGNASALAQLVEDPNYRDCESILLDAKYVSFANPLASPELLKPVEEIAAPAPLVQSVPPDSIATPVPLAHANPQLASPTASQEPLPSTGPPAPHERIFIYYCSVHIFKAIRNAFYDTVLEKKYLLNAKDQVITFQVLMDAWGREEDRKRRGVSARTNLKPDVLVLDQYSKMSVFLALRLFDHDLLSELLSFAREVLGVLELPMPTSDDLKDKSRFLPSSQSDHLYIGTLLFQVSFVKLSSIFY
ncbi:hypothetical protein HDU98_003550 [Podochytrium sp. JEL0797]|nr:hypothetical protein HDU98_003550 [Podochytrium sp. JEL0797]